MSPHRWVAAIFALPLPAVVQLTVRNLRRMVEEDAAFLRSCGIAPEPIERVR